MKRFKIIIWLIIILIIQTTAAHYIRIFDVTPIFILPFAVGITLIEEDFSAAAVAGAVCSACAGSFLGRNFFLSASVIMLFSIAVFSLRMHPRYIHDIWKMLFWTAAITFVWETLSYVLLYHSFEGYINMLFPQVTVSVLYNAAIAGIMYPLIKKTIYKNKEKQKLIMYL